MSIAQNTATMDAVRRIREKILKEFEKIQRKVDIGMDISITTALIDDEVEQLVLIALKEAKRPLSWREFKAIFAGIVGEDRLRRVLSGLKAKNQIAELTHTRYSLPEYVSPNEIDKVKNPGIISKILQKHTQ
ncbi:MAG: hypothetical protein F7C81_04130 [Desulfurococcales archaeon]|nr:hypothetical protein [Desulfurococcales archaeon]MEB3780049.1 hypothetical protein [Desulfurococcales archaeon]